MRSALPLFGALNLGSGMPSQPGGQPFAPQDMQGLLAQILQTLQGQGGQPAMPQLGGTAPSWSSIWPNAINGPTGQPPIGGAQPAAQAADMAEKQGLGGMTDEEWARALGLLPGAGSGGGGM